MLTTEQLSAIADLVIAGGKAAETGANGVILAAQAIAWIRAHVAAMEKSTD